MLEARYQMQGGGGPTVDAVRMILGRLVENVSCLSADVHPTLDVCYIYHGVGHGHE